MPTNLVDIKKELESRRGERIKVTQQAGRKRIIEREGVLDDTFPAVFVVELDKDQHAFERVCYSYTDVLTESIEIDFLEA